MTAPSWGRRWVWVAVVVVMAAGLAAPAQDQPAAPARRASEYRRFSGRAKECKSCHTQPANFRERIPPPVCDMTEFHRWDAEDKHKLAYKALTSDRARRMGEVLGPEVIRSSACTNCHATPLNEPMDNPKGQDELLLANGVACISCHGDNAAWVEKHWVPGNNPEWVKFTRRQKEETYGMTDLWDPVRRAETCASCHVGRVDRDHPDESRIVTHAMYAAGHPMLPSLETATFSEFQPRHWKYLEEKPREIKERQGYVEGEREQAALVAASGLVAFRAVMTLLAEQAAGQGVLKEPATGWPDFARYDCLACHHDLRRPSWRQERGYALAPGRPGAPAWSRALLRLGVEAADSSKARARRDELERRTAALDRALSSRPFGDRDAVVATARALVAWADEVRDDLGHARVGPDEARSLLLALCDEARTTWDYDAARQLAWAFKIIYDEGHKSGGDPEIDRILQALDPLLAMTLKPSGQEPIESALARRLKAVAGYSPEAFHKQFAALAERLSRERAAAGKAAR